MIKKRGDKYCVYGEAGKRNLGCYYTKAMAEKRLKQIEYFKRKVPKTSYNIKRP